MTSDRVKTTVAKTEPKPRRSKGDGGIYFDEKRNLWVATLDLGRDGRGKRQRRRVTGRTKTLALANLKALKSKAEAGPIGSALLTVGGLLDKYHAKGLPPSVKSPNTVDSIELVIRVQLKPRIGTKRLSQLTCDDVDDALAAMISEGYSGAYVRKTHNILTRATRWGEKRGLCKGNVSALCDSPEGPRRESRSLTVEQAGKLLGTVEGERLEAMFVVGLMLGLRSGEMCGLPWDAIDFDTGTLDVRQALIRTRGKELSIGGLKTKKSRRTLTMPAPVVVALKTHRQRQLLERMRAGSAWEDQGLVFPTEIGTLMDPSNLRREFTRCTKKAGLGHWYPHEMRHSASSILQAAGVPAQSVADVLGHASLRMTTEVYRHKIVASASGAVGAMEQLFTKP